MVDEDQKLKIINSQSYNPWYNLALEEYLLKEVAPNEIILYLWQNDHTVVIGRNQNAWKECRCSELEENGGFLARRLSGGGAVYHDLGNLNFTFILGRQYYNLDRQLNVILTAVRRLGIEAEFSGRNDLVIDDRKFSGNAFYFTADKAYHHGTLLVDTDYNKLVNYLQVSEDKIKTKGVESVRSRVVNLKNINKQLTISSLKESLQKSFINKYSSNHLEQNIDYNPEEMIELKDLYDKYSSWKWRYGQTPECDIKFQKRFSWGEIELWLSLKEGYIEEVTIYSDAMDVGLIKELKNVIQGIPFEKEVVLAKISKVKNNEGFFQYKRVKVNKYDIINDIKSWVTDKNF